MSDRAHLHHEPAPFAVECPSCRAHVAVTRDLVHRAVGCPSCRAAFVVPQVDEDLPDPADAPHLDAVADTAARAALGQADQPPGSRAFDEPLVFTAPPPPSGRRCPAEPPDIGAFGGSPQPAATVPPNGLDFREPVKTVRSGGVEIELRRLSAEEKRRRRGLRNLLLLVVGAASLVALAVILGAGRR